MEQYPSYKKWIICIAIFTGSSLGVLVSPIVHTLSTVYPDVPMTTIRAITTIPSLISFILSLFLASFVGKKLSYKASLLIGMGLSFVGGVLPAFWNQSFTQIIIARVIYGVGFSVFAMRNAIITQAFGTKESAKWTGYGFFVTNAISVIGTSISGYLGDIDWRYCFWQHIICVLMFVVILVLFKEPEHDTATEKADAPQEKAVINPRIVIFFLMTLAGTLCLYPFFSSISTFVAERGLGTATQAGWLTSAYTIGGAILGSQFGRTAKRFGRWVSTMSCVMVVMGYILILSSSSIAPGILGALLCGGGFSWLVLSSTQWASAISTPGNRALHMTIISAAVASGSFISTYFMSFAKTVGSVIPLFETEVEKTFLVGIMIYAVLMVLNIVKDFRPASMCE